MKHLLLFSIVLAILCSALYFQQAQQSSFNKTMRTYHGLQKELKTIDNDLNFLKENHKKIDFLTKKGWLHSQSRLISAEAIYQGASSLNAIRFTVEPEVITEIKEIYTFKVSKIIIEMDALLDNYIYDFTNHLLENFPGILILRKFSVRRHENVNKTNLLALRQQKRPNFVIGEMMCEWFVMKGKNNEE